MIEKMNGLVDRDTKRERWHRIAMMGIDAGIIVIAFYLALAVGGHEIADIKYRWYEYLWMFAVLVAVKLFVFERIGFYQEIIRFASMDFALRVVKATVFGSLVAIGIIHIVRRELGMPVLMVDWMASCILIGAFRFSVRYVLEGHLFSKPGKRTLLYGAGEHGATVARHLKKTPQLGCRIVGFIDDDPAKQGKKVHGYSVLGTHHELTQVVRANGIEEIIVSIAAPDGEMVKELYRESKTHGVRCRIVPGICDLVSGKDIVRNIDIADLMRRPKRSLDKGRINHFLNNKRVMLTGAAGSIGSELVRQVFEYGPASVVALDSSEYGLYKLDEEISKHGRAKDFKPSLVDVKDARHVERTVCDYKPDVIFHAAAYKHVPILEECTPQAVLNNVGGTINVANAADKCGVGHFVFISTDKAVRPTSVMGATKRVGELYTQNLNYRSKTRFCSVRFGNVLASSGSVVPKFIEQIKAGGPVTVTHPEVTRYFMLIPEAVELVLQAASIGNGGEIFILDMGKSIRIAEMAEDLITLMGFVPQRDIKIQYTGLRKGEKLYEELFFEDFEKPTLFEDIRIGRTVNVDWDVLQRNIATLMEHARTYDVNEVVAQIKRLVPEYMLSPVSSAFSSATAVPTSGPTLRVEEEISGEWPMNPVKSEA